MTPDLVSSVSCARWPPNRPQRSTRFLHEGLSSSAPEAEVCFGHGEPIGSDGKRTRRSLGRDGAIPRLAP
jgi:hypothetical protein